jgi:hypothetical protein
VPYLYSTTHLLGLFSCVQFEHFVFISVPVGITKTSNKFFTNSINFCSMTVCSEVFLVNRNIG